MDAIVCVILAVVVIAVTTAVAPKLNIAGPLILVLIGIGVGLLPFVPAIRGRARADPRRRASAAALLGGGGAARRRVPPRLRPDRRAVGAARRPQLGGARGLLHRWRSPASRPTSPSALGAILSPTDAVATSIVKRLGISRRVVTMLEGESLLNDATALVLLRTMVAAAALGGGGRGRRGRRRARVHPGVPVGRARRGRHRRRSSATSTCGCARCSATPPRTPRSASSCPFVAYLPTERLGGSGLVAAVVAGIVTGQGAARWFTPEQRLSDELNWRTIELVLEGAVFLLMGLELKEIVDQNLEDHDGLGTGIGLALGALAIILVVRAAYVALLVWLQSRRARGKQRQRLEQLSRRLDDIAARREPADRARATGARAAAPQRGAMSRPRAAPPRRDARRASPAR